MRNICHGLRGERRGQKMDKGGEMDQVLSKLPFTSKRFLRRCRLPYPLLLPTCFSLSLDLSPQRKRSTIEYFGKPVESSYRIIKKKTTVQKRRRIHKNQLSVTPSNSSPPYVPDSFRDCSQKISSSSDDPRVRLLIIQSESVIIVP